MDSVSVTLPLATVVATSNLVKMRFTYIFQFDECQGSIFKACVRHFLLNFYFSPKESPLKTMKSAFYFI